MAEGEERQPKRPKLAEEVAVAVAPAPPESLYTDANFWGRHLRADYRHDGYIDPPQVYNIGGAAAVENIGDGRTKEFGEHTFWDYANRLASGDATFKARMNAKIEFELCKKTLEFKPFPMMSIIGNERVGIVMDAGANITEELGAKNVITFGMCIDSAGSPVSPERRPIYHHHDGAVYIDLAQFGFEPSIIRGIWIIADVAQRGQGVKTAWILGPDYRVYDPVSKQVVGTLAEGTYNQPAFIPGVVARLGTKVVNQLVGDYTSRESATTVTEMIGKTLGDTMIVASAMAQFAGGVPNPFYGIGNPGWRDLGREEDMPMENTPTMLVVKTGDVLNAVRAIFKGVPVILERYRKNASNLEFEFYPGVADEGDIVRRIPESYPKMVAAVEQRYSDLIRDFIDSLQGDGETEKLRSGHTRFVGDRTRFRFDDTKGHYAKAGRLFREIIGRLEALRESVKTHFTARQANMTARIDALGAGALEAGFIPEVAPPESRPEKRPRRTVSEEGEDSFRRIIADYNADLEHLKNLCPQTDKMGRLRDDETKLLNPIIPITRVGPDGFSLIGRDRPIQDMEIRLITAFQTIVATENRVEADYRGTVFFQRFFDPPAPPAGAAAALEPSYEGELRDYADDVIGVSPVGGQRGGAVAGFEFVRFNNDGRESLHAASIPLIVRFIDYYIKHLGGSEDKPSILGKLYQLVQNRNSNRIVSPTVLETIREELGYLRQMGIVRYAGDIPANPVVAGDTSTPETLVYNAFVMSINRQNATMYMGDRDIGFGVLEERFLNKMRVLNSRPPAPVAAAPVPAPVAVVGDTLTQGYPPSGSEDESEFSIANVGSSQRTPPRESGHGSGPPTERREDVEHGVVTSPGVVERGAQTARALEEEARRSGGATPRRKKNRKSTYRLQKKHRK